MNHEGFSSARLDSQRVTLFLGAPLDVQPMNNTHVTMVMTMVMIGAGEPEHQTCGFFGLCAATYLCATNQEVGLVGTDRGASQCDLVECGFHRFPLVALQAA